MTATGSTLVVPPRWMHIPGMAALASLLPADAIADAPELGARAESFEAGLRAARTADPGGTVLDTSVHVGTFPGTVVDASVVVARIDLEPDAAADVEQLLVFRGAREDARVVDVAGVAGIEWTLAEHDADELAAVAPHSFPLRDGRPRRLRFSRVG